MTDRELLERAAGALGWRLVGYDGTTAVVVADGRTFGWRPLIDTNDALRLAAKLIMNIEWDAAQVTAVTPIRDVEAEEVHIGKDLVAATCRAIVRAAAAMAPEVPS
jgi:hypothetical protein